MKLITSLFAISLSLSAPVFAEHSHDGDHDHSHEHTETKEADVTITITGSDTMQFDKKTFEVTEGQTIKVIFKNAGTMPKEAMGHNLVILTPGTEEVTFAMAGISNTADYLPTDEENKSKIVAASKILGPGEEDILTFTAGEPGEYPYLCSFPGHFSIMKGVMTVKAK